MLCVAQRADGDEGRVRAGASTRVKDHDEELFQLQKTLYDSNNPTRRWSAPLPT